MRIQGISVFVLLAILVAFGTTMAQARPEFELLTLSQDDADQVNDAFRAITHRYAPCPDNCGWKHLNAENSVDAMESANADDSHDRNYILRTYADVKGKHIAFEYVYWPKGGQLCGSMYHFFKNRDGSPGTHINPLTPAELRELLPRFKTALNYYAYK